MENNQNNRNMVPCRVCGNMIAKSAKKCPHCGAKNKKPIYKRLWFIILCIIVLLGIIGMAMGGGNDKGTNVNTDSDTSVETVAEEPETEAPETKAPDPTADMTMAQKNAYNAGLNYIDLMPFSKQGLIDQLSSEYGDGYDKADAEAAVEAIEKNGLVDWNEEAVEAAQNYLDTMSFSKEGLIEQLESSYGDNFTHEQAVQAVEKVYK